MYLLTIVKEGICSAKKFPRRISLIGIEGESDRSVQRNPSPWGDGSAVTTPKRRIDQLSWIRLHHLGVQVHIFMDAAKK